MGCYHQHFSRQNPIHGPNHAQIPMFHSSLSQSSSKDEFIFCFLVGGSGKVVPKLFLLCCMPVQAGNEKIAVILVLEQK